jgi:hypothetical protein
VQRGLSGLVGRAGAGWLVGLLVAMVLVGVLRSRPSRAPTPPVADTRPVETAGVDGR